MSIREHLEKPKVKQTTIPPHPEAEVRYSDLLAEFRKVLDACERFRVDELLSKVREELFQTENQEIRYFFVPTKYFLPVQELEISPLLNKKFPQKLAKLGALFVKQGQQNTNGEPFIRARIRKTRGTTFIGFEKRDSEERVYTDIFPGAVQVEGKEMNRFDDKNFSFDKLETVIAVAWDHPKFTFDSITKTDYHEYK